MIDHMIASNSNPQPQQPTVHDLKCLSKFFWAVRTGKKPFEIRKNDRDFQVGHFLRLHEYDPQSGYSSQSSELYEVIYVTDFEQKPGYVVMGIKSVLGELADKKTLNEILTQVQRDLGDRVQISGLEFETEGGV